MKNPIATQFPYKTKETKTKLLNLTTHKQKTRKSGAILKSYRPSKIHTHKNPNKALNSFKSEHVNIELNKIKRPLQISLMLKPQKPHNPLNYHEKTHGTELKKIPTTKRPVME
jgi:hypothetical protein